MSLDSTYNFNWNSALELQCIWHDSVYQLCILNILLNSFWHILLSNDGSIGSGAGKKSVMYLKESLAVHYEL